MITNGGRWCGTPRLLALLGLGPVALWPAPVRHTRKGDEQGRRQWGLCELHVF